MKDELTVIRHDMFDISDRLKAIDEFYFVCYNRTKHRYEVHNSNQRGGTLALITPYSSLDYRTISLTIKSRCERAVEFLKQIEKENEAIDKKNIAEQVKKAEKNLEHELAKC